MRQKILILSLVFMPMLAACTDEKELMTPSNESQMDMNSISSSFRSLEEARQVALSGIKMIQQDEAKSETRASDRPERKLTEPIVKTRPSTRADGDTDTLMYVFNFADDQGYAIVDARVQNPGLIAVTEKGHYTENIQGLSDEDPQKIINSLVDGYIQKDVYDSIPLRARIWQRVEIDTVITNINPRVTVKWDQDYPFDYFTPNGSAGCGIIAMMQVMSFYEYPSQRQGLTYANHDVASIDLDWDTFKLHTESHSPNSTGCITQAKHQDMGRFARQLGHMTGSIYNTNNTNNTDGSTSTSNSQMYSCMTNLGFTCTPWNDYTTGSLYNILNSGGVVIMRGSTSTDGGHAWVVDGIRKLQITYDHYVSYYSINGPWLNDEHVVTFEEYNHINWGWTNGECNGYFLDGIFDVQHPKWVDFPEVPSDLDYNFISDLKIMHVLHN